MTQRHYPNDFINQFICGNSVEMQTTQDALAIISELAQPIGPPDLASNFDSYVGTEAVFEDGFTPKLSFITEAVIKLC